MSSIRASNKRAVSGMRPTGALHLGHYHSVLKNWTELQMNYECFFFVADWHALTTHYESSADISHHVENMVIDWLACGISPSSATLFVQSHVPEHAELHLILSMITPLAWLERAPSYKEQLAYLKERDLSTYGFLGYPLLQAADILTYGGEIIPVGEDQVAHIELTRDIARRFNHLYGREAKFEEKAERAIGKMGKKNAKLYQELRKRYQEQGDDEALARAQAMIEAQQNISLNNKERLLGYLEGSSKLILSEPQAQLDHEPHITGLDGHKMSKACGNTIDLRDSNDQIEQKIRTMPTDPARARRKDAGEPNKCPVWAFHQRYSQSKTQDWAREGCRSAAIGCLECKEPIVIAVQQELKPIHERIAELEESRPVVQNLLLEGAESARQVARETLDDVQEALRFHHRA